MDEDRTFEMRQQRDGSWILEFDYHPEFVEALKGAVPHTRRTYDPGSKTWTLRRIEDARRVARLARTCFESAEAVIHDSDGGTTYHDLIGGGTRRQETLFR